MLHAYGSLPLSADIWFPKISVFLGFLCCGPGDAGAAALVLQWEGCAFSYSLFSFRMFVAQQIASSNLLLLVIDAACDCSIFPPVLMNAKEVKYILPRTTGKGGPTGPFVSGLWCSGEKVTVLSSSPARRSQRPSARLSDALYEGEGGTGQNKGLVVWWVQLG